MIKDKIIKRSPLRILEKSIRGGLGRGNVAVLASRKGVGKTACLVHIATDKLFQEKPVIHVSYSSRVDYIINWYEDIIKEIAKSRKVKAAADIQESIIKNRVIMNFKQDAARTEQVLRSVEALIVHGKFAADTIIIDGYDFARTLPDDLSKFKDFAGRLGIEIWFSASLRGEEPIFDEQGVPFLLRHFLGAIDVLITLVSHGDHVHLRLVKDHDHLAPKELGLKLDATTLLIAKER